MNKNETLAAIITSNLQIEIMEHNINAYVNVNINIDASKYIYNTLTKYVL